MKKLLAVLLSAAVMASSIPAIAAASYSDTEGHWAQEQIESFTELGLVTGYNGTFRPDASITRGELAVILDQVMDYQTAAANRFADLDQNFYTDAILKANAAGVMAGDGNTVRPNDPITRQEAAVMIAQAFRLEQAGSLDQFQDKGQVASWAAGAVSALADRGYVQGFDGKFNPTSPITRAEVVTILNQAIGKLVSAGEQVMGDVDGSVVIRGAGAVLSDMTIGSDLIIADGVADGDVTLDNVTVQGQVIVRGGGEHSILLNNVRVNGGLIVNKLDGRVRIVTSGNTDVSVTLLESGAILVGDGFETVEISAEMAAGQVVELDGKFTTLINNSSAVTIKATGEIKSVTAAATTNITGTGLTIGATTGGSDVILNDKVLPSTGTSGSTSGGGGGGSSSDDDEGQPTPPDTDEAYSISLDTTVLSLKVGAEKTLTATVTVPRGQDDTVTWTSSDSEVASVSTTGLVSALTPGNANITASILNNAYSVTCDVTVIEAAIEPEPEPGWNESTHTDARFAEGYPICSTDANGHVVIRLKVDQASEQSPVEAYMVVNQTNSGTPTDSTAVLHGHAGLGDDLIRVDSVEYVKLTSSDEVVISTDLGVDGKQGIDVHFVLKDEAGGVSQTPTTVVYGKELAAEEDQVPPVVIIARINQARDTIYLHFEDDMDAGSVPAASAFTLNGVENAALSGSVSLEQCSDPKNTWGAAWYLKLGVTGIGQNDDISGLTISYTPPTENPLQDCATVPNQVMAFQNESVLPATVRLNPEDIHISADGQYIYFKTENSEYFFKDTDWYTFTLTNSAGDIIQWKSNGASYYNIHEQMQMQMWLERTGGATIGADGRVTVTLTPADGMVDFAMDAVDKPITATGTAKENPLSIASAVYNADTNELTVNIAGEPASYASSFACNFQLKDPQGNLYTLRGNLQYWTSSGKSASFLFNGDNMTVTPQVGWTLVYSVQHTDVQSHEIIVGITGEPLAEAEVTITAP